MRNMSKEEFEKLVKNSKITDHNPVDPQFHSEVPESSVKQKWILDVQWSDCPSFVEAEVRKLWRDYELGNDNYICKRTVDQELYADYPNIYTWLLYKGVPQDEEVWIHWWW